MQRFRRTSDSTLRGFLGAGDCEAPSLGQFMSSRMAGLLREAAEEGSMAVERVLVVGAGAIGGSVAGWLAAAGVDVTVLARGENAAAIRARGIALYDGGRPEERAVARVRVVGDAREAAGAEVVAFCVKNYSLEEAAGQVRAALGDGAIAVGLQNGVLNQKVLGALFPRAVYAVIAYNAWLDGPGVVGFQRKGPIVVGTPGNARPGDVARVAAIFSRGVGTEATDRFQDAAHCKIVLNLASAITTLAGHGVVPIDDMALFQRLLAGALWEGVGVVRAAGHRECRLGGMPSWRLLWASAHLPPIVTRPLFRRNLRKLVMSSMGQDIFSRKSGKNELDEINGRIVALADAHGLPAPINRAILGLCQSEFARPGFKPLSMKDIWARVSARG